MKAKTKESHLALLFKSQLKAVGIGGWTEEIHFHPTRKWRFDIGWVIPKLAIEIDGGMWTGGRHIRAYGYEADCEKLNEALLLGWRVIRVTGDMVKDGRALNVAERAIEAVERLDFEMMERAKALSSSGA